MRLAVVGDVGTVGRDGGVGFANGQGAIRGTLHVSKNTGQSCACNRVSSNISSPLRGSRINHSSCDTCVDITIDQGTTDHVPIAPAVELPVISLVLIVERDRIGRRFTVDGMQARTQGSGVVGTVFIAVVAEAPTARAHQAGQVGIVDLTREKCGAPVGAGGKAIRAAQHDIAASGRPGRIGLAGVENDGRAGGIAGADRLVDCQVAAAGVHRHGATGGDAAGAACSTNRERIGIGVAHGFRVRRQVCRIVGHVVEGKTGVAAQQFQAVGGEGSCLGDGAAARQVESEVLGAGGARLQGTIERHVAIAEQSEVARGVLGAHGTAHGDVASGRAADGQSAGCDLIQLQLAHPQDPRRCQRVTGTHLNSNARSPRCNADGACGADRCARSSRCQIQRIAADVDRGGAQGAGAIKPCGRCTGGCTLHIDVQGRSGAHLAGTLNLKTDLWRSVCTLGTLQRDIDALDRRVVGINALHCTTCAGGPCQKFRFADRGEKSARGLE